MHATFPSSLYPSIYHSIHPSIHPLPAVIFLVQSAHCVVANHSLSALPPATINGFHLHSFEGNTCDQ